MAFAREGREKDEGEWEKMRKREGSGLRPTCNIPIRDFNFFFFFKVVKSRSCPSLNREKVPFAPHFLHNFTLLPLGENFLVFILNFLHKISVSYLLLVLATSLEPLSHEPHNILLEFKTTHQAHNYFWLHQFKPPSFIFWAFYSIRFEGTFQRLTFITSCVILYYLKILFHGFY